MFVQIFNSSSMQITRRASALFQINAQPAQPKQTPTTRRHFGSGNGATPLPENCEELGRESVCPNTACKGGPAKRGQDKTWWKKYFAPIEDVVVPKPNPRCCRIRYCQEKDDPDLSEFGGQAYRTAGAAYVIQRDLVPPKPETLNEETRQLHEIEAHPQLKTVALRDPIMDDIQCASLRLLEICDRRLHPLYRKIQMTIKSLPENHPPVVAPSRNSRNNDSIVMYDELPGDVLVNRVLMEKKNLSFAYKRAQPPASLLGPIIEMKQVHRYAGRGRFFRPNGKCPERAKPSADLGRDFDVQNSTTDTTDHVFATLRQNGSLLNNLMNRF